MSGKKITEENVTNTKYCNNCCKQSTKAGYCDEKLLKVNKFACRIWQRDPSAWLSILPTEPGWYWFDNNGGIDQVVEFSGCGYVYRAGSEEFCSLSQMKGQFQGPITPAGK